MVLSRACQLKNCSTSPTRWRSSPAVPAASAIVYAEALCEAGAVVVIADVNAQAAERRSRRPRREGLRRGRHRRRRAVTGVDGGHGRRRDRRVRRHRHPHQQRRDHDRPAALRSGEHARRRVGPRDGREPPRPAAVHAGRRSRRWRPAAAAASSTVCRPARSCPAASTASASSPCTASPSTSRPSSAGADINVNAIAPGLVDNDSGYALAAEGLAVPRRDRRTDPGQDVRTARGPRRRAAAAVLAAPATGSRARRS